MTPLRRLLITGGSGFLGSSLTRHAQGLFQVYAAFHTHPPHNPGHEAVNMDITDADGVMTKVERIRPHLIVNTAALADVDLCQQEPGLAKALNIEGARNMARAAEAVGAGFIHISTDAVFDGRRGMYSEADPPQPVNEYGRTKRLGEAAVAETLPRSIIVRTAFYGWSPPHKTTLAEWVVENLTAGRQIGMFTDVFFSPILTDNLAQALWEMHELNLSDIYHVGGAERLSKHDFGLEIASAFGLDSKLIHPCSVDDKMSRAPRPKDISLNTGKAAGVLKTRLWGVAEGVARLKESRPLNEETAKGRAQ